MSEKNVLEMSQAELLELSAELEEQYLEFKNRGVKLDMSRGRPSAAQLDIAQGAAGGVENYIGINKFDYRNYGILDGIPEMKQYFAELLGLHPEEIIVGGNASLNLMYDSMTRLLLKGTAGEKPWKDLSEVKFLCPCPGYDRHFAICEHLGIKMINVPMTATGPDMDMVEKLVAEDAAIKGMWCVPLYSNPEGICYSDETVDRLASMKCAAPDFRIFWDNAYGVHHLYDEETQLKNILEACRNAGNPDRVLYFFSTSKITFPGAGVSMVASSENNRKEILKTMGIQTIGYDKMNQVRTLNFLKDAANTKLHMKKLADSLREKFDIVLTTLERNFAGTGFASWHTPRGGYFVALDTMPGCAKETIRLAADAGVKLTEAGATFPYHNDPNDSNIRIAPSFPPCSELREAMYLLCICIKLTAVRKLLTK
ncbi:MAG: aminotransferase class I/II-fold pyridoxal phosphate-dependent enzyme [Lentisphaeria bacterium]|nr:aminotransferase class I/II-fold pyridoxal phosphate-dependent enzyme [Lentisphaeria bacterium]